MHPAVMSDQHPPDIPDVSGPSRAGLYDVLLGGQDHYTDAAAAVRLFSQRWPSVAGNGPANRGFLRRAVTFLAEQGVEQFLELGCGKPTVGGNVHQVAQSIVPDARAVYVDNDPTVLAHARAMTERDPGIAYIQDDIRNADAILNHPATLELIDPTQPVGVLLVTTLHYIPDDPAGLVERYLRDVAEGSFVAISHACSDGADPEMLEALKQPVFGGLTPRPAGQILALFGQRELVDPGHLVDVRHWRSGSDEPVSDQLLLCGVAAA